jgi:hypothetical protein
MAQNGQTDWGMSLKGKAFCTLLANQMAEDKVYNGLGQIAP